MRRFLWNPRAFVDPGHPAFDQLSYGWDNGSWAGGPEFLAGCIAAALAGDGPILECGSGLSTVLLAVIVARRGERLWSLEHHEEWASKTRRYLDAYRLESVVLSVAPLRSYGLYQWYQPPLESMPARFSLVVCDGPPGSTPGGRYGLLPVMKDRIAPGGVILLDDAQRSAELKIAQRWSSELGGSFFVVGERRPYIVLTLPPGTTVDE